MRAPLIVMVVLFACSHVDAQVTKPVARTGPSAASLATPYSGPIKFNARVLATERSAAFDPNPITRAASWRHRYSAPYCYYGYNGYYGCYGYRPYLRGYGRGFYPLTGGATSQGWWGPY